MDALVNPNPNSPLNSPGHSGQHVTINYLLTNPNAQIPGNAGSASKLATARTINGVPFDSTAPITITAAAGTLTGTTLASNVLASSLTSVGTLTGLSVASPIIMAGNTTY